MDERLMPDLEPPPVDVDFMLIGGTKCATTWLSEKLRAHPEVTHSVDKSPDFFSTDRYDRGWASYVRQWPDQTGVCGESSTSYLYSERALERIHRWFPEIQILILLRDPWERARSHVRHKLRVDDPEDLDSYLAERPHLITDSLYAGPLEAVYRRFSADSVQILYYDHVQRAPNEVLRRAYTHIGVDPTFEPPNPARVVGGGFTPRWKRLERMKRRIAEALRSAGMNRLIRIGRNRGLLSVYRCLNDGSRLSTQRSIERIDAALSTYRDLMLDDVRKLLERPELERSEILLGWHEALERQKASDGERSDARDR